MRSEVEARLGPGVGSYLRQICLATAPMRRFALADAEAGPGPYCARSGTGPILRAVWDREVVRGEIRGNVTLPSIARVGGPVRNNTDVTK